MKLGYIPGPPGNRNSNQMKTHGLLMDGLKVYSTSDQQLEKVIQQTVYVMEKTGKECTTKSVKITDEKIIEGLKEGKFYVYLGMSQRADCEDKVIKNALKKEFYRRNRIVWKSLLSASNKGKAFNSICIGVLSYSFGVINWTKVELEEMDIRVRKEMTMNKAFNKHSDTDRLYLQRNRGSRGLICIQDFCDSINREYKVMALQQQEVGVKVTRKEIWKEQLENVTCRGGQRISCSYNVWMPCVT